MLALLHYFPIFTIHMDLIQNEDYAADSCAISPTAFLLKIKVNEL